MTPRKISAVDSFNGSGNPNRQNIGYNFFNKPVFIATDSDSLVYTYKPLDQRIKAVSYNESGQMVKTTWYAGLYEKVVEDTLVRHCYYINSPDGLVAMAIQNGTGTPAIYYICKDHLDYNSGPFDSGYSNTGGDVNTGVHGGSTGQVQVKTLIKDIAPKVVVGFILNTFKFGEFLLYPQMFVMKN